MGHRGVQSTKVSTYELRMCHHDQTYRPPPAQPPAQLHGSVYPDLGFLLPDSPATSPSSLFLFFLKFLGLQPIPEGAQYHPPPTTDRSVPPPPTTDGSVPPPPTGFTEGFTSQAAGSFRPPPNGGYGTFSMGEQNNQQHNFNKQSYQHYHAFNPHENHQATNTRHYYQNYHNTVGNITSAIFNFLTSCTRASITVTFAMLFLLVTYSLPSFVLHCVLGLPLVNVQYWNQVMSGCMDQRQHRE